jgi:Putative adhesin
VGWPGEEAAMATWKIDGPQRLSTDEPVERLDISLISANVNVVGTDGPARIEVTKVGTKALIVEQVGGVLRVRHEDQPTFPSIMWWMGMLGRKYHVELSLAVPHDAVGDLKVQSGSVVASGLRAGALIDVTSGRVTMLGLDGRVTAKVVSGSIEALGVGGELSMETISGEITLADSAASRVFARAVSGSLTCDLDNPYGSDIRLETTSGSITARIREDSDLDVHLQATSGRVSTDFWQLRPAGSYGMRSAHGRLGAGTGSLKVTAVSGNISLLARPVEPEEPVEPGEPVDHEERA